MSIQILDEAEDDLHDGRETTTPTDSGSGIVQIEVGFAPLRAAEFVVLRVQQSTARSEP